ncbi:MAG TPA: nitrate- and nitrite sensing domain-containing protein [Pseudonocardiaceae bacterium]
MRTKLFAVLLIPAIAAVVLGGLQVSTELAGVQDLGRTVRQVELGVRVSDLVHELQRERELMSGYVATGRQGDRASLDVQMRRVDGLSSSVRAAGAQLQGLDDLVQSAYQQSISSLDSLNTLREVAQGTRYSDQAVITAYSAMIGTLLDLRREVTRATTNRDVADIAGAADALGRAKEQVAQQHAVLLVASLHNLLPPNDVQAIRVADSRYGASLSEFYSVADPVERQKFSDTVTGPEVDLRERIKQGAVQAAVAGNAPNINLGEWDVAAGTTADRINTVEAGLNGQLRGAALSLREKAGADVVRDATILLGSLFATMLLVVVVARSMLVPLRTLRNTAFDVADRRLPEAIRRIRDTDDVPDISVAPVAVYTREEIGQVARAFDAVHGEAVRLAAEQSLLRRNVNDMFVNLSRRSQGLVERQLRLIDQLENSEQDPEQLSNLFQLDHLATRMRRNSENLLVLAGAELARRSTRPVPAVDVLRAAVSEVEEYQRIVVQTPPSVNILGLAVNDLVHLVAELLDNATTFSPPDSRVIVGSSLTEHGEFVVEITDQGVGMPYEQLVEANHRLTDPPMIDVSVSRRMGLFVVGRLASRHGVFVRLSGNEGEPGLTAAVTVPADLVQAGELSDFGPTTDSVPVPAQRPAADFLPTQVIAPQALEQHPWQQAQQQRQEEEWNEVAARWPATEAEREPEPEPYPPGAPPMQVSMVDSVSGMDLFTPASLPNLADRDERPQEQYDPYDPYSGSYPTSDEHLREVFGREYEDQPTGQWPDTDQDERDPYSAPTLTNLQPVHDYAAPPPPPQREDHLGVGREVAAQAQAPAPPPETTPIYEEMVSAWFRELTPPAPAVSRPTPTYVEPPPFEMPTMDVPQPPPARQHQHQPQQQRRPEPQQQRPAAMANGAGANGAPDPLRGRHAAPGANGTPQAPQRQHQPPPQQRPQPGRVPEPVAERTPERVPDVAPDHYEQSEPAAADNGEVWRSPADEGWRAASALVAPVDHGFTAAGLPKRRRGAHLVPGAAATPTSAAPTATPRRARNADDVRGRLASYQQGLRQGRDFRRDLAHVSSDTEHTAQPSKNEESQ